LLAYLVRRLLENGANSSFVHRIWDENVSVEELAADPVALARAVEPLGAPHPVVALPREILGERRNSAGLDLSDENTLAELGDALRRSAQGSTCSRPIVAGQTLDRPERPVLNPADHSDQVGLARFALPADAVAAVAAADAAVARWCAVPVDQRAACLERAADLMEARMPALLGLIVREAGKSLPNAIAEVREAVDFLRYYAAEARRTLGVETRPLGAVVCISPWNFPLAIFTGQIAAALAAGNTVLAKPAEETPLIAAEGVRILHEAGIPAEALHLLPGAGDVGAALVGAAQTAGVLFTGSTEVAKLIQAELAGHTAPHGAPIPLIAETGGQNAMIVDSSALAEQVVFDVIASAFDSAGQRCSALRVLCLQDDVADRQLAMLKGALAELALGRPDRLSVDIGPVISAEARWGIEDHIARMRAAGCRVEQLPLPSETARGTFVAPTIIEIESITQLSREVFGPVLHVLRWKRDELDALIDAINATGYGLTFGLHTRLDEVVERVTARAGAGNVYVNRNVIGAVVGVQPFGGRGLSGTGPKAGGPLYLGRLVQSAPETGLAGQAPDPVLGELAGWLEQHGEPGLAQRARSYRALNGHAAELPGPVGERNLYALHPRGRVLALPNSREGLLAQLVAALGEGNRVAVVWPGITLDTLPALVAQRIDWLPALPERSDFAAVLIEPRSGGIAELLARVAAMDGPIPLVQMADAAGHYRADWLVEEVSVSINTTAAGGNASLMALV
ncbi:MAG TPA: bifunctional proline dehydrogenase/L-glutamate gamma-semialdehyde dehydrogenase PutA, partial [Novosphingobium sp.]|nr:bifunctional proline dehydrogenase/L-glutamate gamma-semialdehyde dehydrogenase PutA [Novosphingobium sp.]